MFGSQQMRVWHERYRRIQAFAYEYNKKYLTVSLCQSSGIKYIDWQKYLKSITLSLSYYYFMACL